MVSSLPPLHPAAPKPPPSHFLRPRKASSYNPKCLCCAHSCMPNRNRHVETEPAASPSPLITPADPWSSLKFKIRLKKKGDNAAEYPDQSKSSDIRIIKPTCSSANAAVMDCLKICLKKKGDNAAEYQDQSKSFEIRINNPSSSADAPQEDCRNTTPATELLRISENRKRKSVGAEKRPEFSLSLSKKEIEEDFLAMTDAKPPRRPTKRPKHVQEQLNSIFPGVYLSKRVTEARYKVRRSDLQ